MGLELKAERGRLTDIQRITHERLREAGAEVATAIGVDEALAQLEQWRLLRPDSLKSNRTRIATTSRQCRKARGAHSPPTPSNREIGKHE